MSDLVDRQAGTQFVPGEYCCAKCGFTLSQFSLNANTGQISDRDAPGEKCPNDGSPLWRVTWKQRAEEHFKRAVEEMDRADAAEREVDRLTRERDEAYGYASRFLTAFTQEHFKSLSVTPLPDLIGVLTQIDNATMIASEYRSELTALRQRVVEVVGPFARVVPYGIAADHEEVTLPIKARHFRAARALHDELTQETTDGK